MFTNSNIQVSHTFTIIGLLADSTLKFRRNFLKKWLPRRFYKKCFKKFMDNIHVVKRTTLTVEKKPLVIVLPYLGSISLQTILTKLNKSLKNILNCCKLHSV